MTLASSLDSSEEAEPVTRAYSGERSQQTGVKDRRQWSKEGRREGGLVIHLVSRDDALRSRRGCTWEFSVRGKKKESANPRTPSPFWRLVSWGVDSLATSSSHGHVYQDTVSKEPRAQTEAYGMAETRHWVHLHRGGCSSNGWHQRWSRRWETHTHKMSNMMHYKKKRPGAKKKKIFSILSAYMINLIPV